MVFYVHATESVILMSNDPSCHTGYNRTDFPCWTCVLDRTVNERFRDEQRERVELIWPPVTPWS